jgi:ATP-binding cassette, subfamily B, bacterial
MAQPGAREFHLEHLPEYDTRSSATWIVSHSLRYWWLPVTVVVTAIVNNAAYGNVPLFIGRGFDLIASPGWTTRQLLVVALIVAVSAVVQGITGLARNVATELLAQRVERDSREELYTSLLGKSQSFHAGQRVGDIMARATNDVRALNMMFSPGLMLIIDSSLALLVPFGMILFIDLRLGLVPAIFTALLVLTVIDYNRRLAPVSIAQREEFGRMNGTLTEAISGIEVVKGSVQERYEIDKFLGRARAYRDYFVEQGEVQARYWPMLAFAVSWGLALFHALLLWRTGSLSLGEVVSFMGLFGTFRFATFISIFSFNLVQLGLASADRILQLIRAETRLDHNREGHRGRILGEIELRDVSFAFSSKPVLQNISLKIAPGETIALVGQTGSGKTTLARLINRIFDVDSGQVVIDGHDVREWSLESLRSQISTIEQDIFLYSMSIRENIAFGRQDASEVEIVTAARQAQADGFIRTFRDGYDTEIGERGVTLSGGQKQRLAIARAFLTDPRVLILDDSTSAIDSRTEDEIQRAMRAVATGRTTIIITHRLSQIRHADRVVLIRRGRLLDVGTHDALMERSDDYRRIFAHA